MYDPDHLYDQDRRYEPPPLVAAKRGTHLLGLIACALLVIVLVFVIWVF